MSVPPIKSPTKNVKIDKEQDDEEVIRSKHEKLKAEQTRLKESRKAEVAKFLEEQKQLNNKPNVVFFKELVQVPTTPGDLLKTIDEWEVKGYFLYSNIYFYNQIYLIFKKGKIEFGQIKPITEIPNIPEIPIVKEILARANEEITEDIEEEEVLESSDDPEPPKEEIKPPEPKIPETPKEEEKKKVNKRGSKDGF